MTIHKRAMARWRAAAEAREAATERYQALLKAREYDDPGAMVIVRDPEDELVVAANAVLAAWTAVDLAMDLALGTAA